MLRPNVHRCGRQCGGWPNSTVRVGAVYSNLHVLAGWGSVEQHRCLCRSGFILHSTMFAPMGGLGDIGKQGQPGNPKSKQLQITSSANHRCSQRATSNARGRRLCWRQGSSQGVFRRPCVLIACNVLSSVLLFRHFRRTQQQLHADVQYKISVLRADVRRTADDLHSSLHQAEESLAYLATVYGRRFASHDEQLNRLERYVLASFEEQSGSTLLPASVCFA